MNFKVMWSFLRDSLTQSSLYLTLTQEKFFTCTLQFSSEGERSYPLTCLKMLSSKIITFFVCSEVLPFHPVALG